MTPMDMTEIAKRAAAAGEALEALAVAVRNLPQPKFNFGRSIELLRQLSEWADRSRPDAEFDHAGVLSTVLAAGLKGGCEGRDAQPARRGSRPKRAEAPESPISDGSQPVSIKAIATQLGRRGGESRSKAKVAAARANMQKINRKRWGSRRPRRVGRQRTKSAKR